MASESLMLAVGAEIARARAGLKGLSKEADKASSRVGATSEKMSSKARKAFSGASVALGGFAGLLGGASVQAAADFETSIKKLATIAGDDTDQLRAEILKLDPALGSAKGAAEAAYQAISAGAKPAEAIKLVEEAAIAAKGGFTDTETAVDAVTTIMNSFGESAGTSAEIFDKFLQTQNLGKTTFDEMARSIGDVAATASAFGTSFDELQGMIAQVTASGIQTPKAITGIRQAMVNLQKPTKDAGKALRGLGFEKIKTVFGETKKVFDDEAFRKFLGDEGIIGLLERIKNDAPDTGLAISDIFGSVEAQNAVNAMLGNFDETKAAIDAISDSAGSAQAAASTVGESFTEEMAAIKNAMNQILIGVGSELLPEIRKITGQILENMDTVKAVVGGFGTAIKTVVDGVGFIGTGLGEASVAVEQLASGNWDAVSAKMESVKDTLNLVVSGIGEDMESIRVAADTLLGIINSIVKGVEIISGGLGTAKAVTDRLREGDVRGATEAAGIADNIERARKANEEVSFGRRIAESLPVVGPALGAKRQLGAFFGTSGNEAKLAPGAEDEEEGGALSFLGLSGGGVVPGTGNRDSVPAMLTPGEVVIPKRQVQHFAEGGVAGAAATVLPGTAGIGGGNIAGGSTLPGTAGIGGGSVLPGGGSLSERIRAFFAKHSAEGVEEGVVQGGETATGSAKGDSAGGLALSLKDGLFDAGRLGIETAILSGDVDKAKEQFTNALKETIIRKVKEALIASLGSKLLGGIGIPGFAAGGTTPGGPIIVGERGPELLSPPRGSRVTDAETTKSMVGGVTINGNVVLQAPENFDFSDRNMKRLAQQLSTRVRKGQVSLDATRARRVERIA